MGLEALENEVIKIIDATAFEKDKTYLIKIDCGDLTTEACERTLQSIRDIFSNKGIDVIVYPNRIKIEAAEIKKENDSKNIVDFI